MGKTFFILNIFIIIILAGCGEGKKSHSELMQQHKSKLRGLCIQEIEKEIGHSGLLSARVTDYYPSRGGYALVIRYRDKGRERAATCGAPFKQALTANDVNLVNDFGGF